MSYRELSREALKLALPPLCIGILITPLRFALEFAGIEEAYIFYIGLLWLSLGVSVFWAIKYANHSKPLLLIFLALLFFSPISRIPVSVAWWIDNKFQLGTHYGLYFQSFSMSLLNQVFYGTLVQLIPSMILATVIVLLKNKFSE